MPQNKFALAVDVGTSRTAAAIARSGAGGAPVVTPFPLGRRSDSIATTVFVASDGELVFGDTAERRGIGQPERFVRDFKRHIGDDVPLSVGGRAFPPEVLFAQSVAAVVETVSTREGARPALVSITHPTAWGPHRLGLIAEALRRSGLDDIVLLAEPEAAAHHYEAIRPLAVGARLGVYDLGGGTFDAVILRKEPDGAFATNGTAVGIEDLGGADFDDTVLRYVLDAAGVDTAALSIDDADTRLALSQLRRECIEAKEALSFDAEVTIPVLLPSAHTTVRLTRSEFERMIEPALERTLSSLEAALDSADVSPEDLEAILLVGGSSRIPLVAQQLSDRFDRPLAVDADPKAAVALGAARLGLAALEARTVPSTTQTTAFDALLAETAERLVAIAAADTTGPARTPEHALRRRAPVLAVTAGAAVAATLAWGSITAAASWTGAPASDDAVEGSTRVAASAQSGDVSPWPLPMPAPAPGPKTVPATEQPKSDAEARDQANGERTPRDASRRTSRDPSARPEPRGTAGSNSPRTSPAPRSAPLGPATSPAPAESPVDPAPSDPSADPPADPTPTDPPADPTPTDPPADPTPTDPPAGPTPTDPPAEPVPTEAPVAPTPEPTQPV